MTSTNKDPILVVVQLTGGNDYINTVIPYQDPLYYDSRKKVSVTQEEVLPISDELAFNPAFTAVKDLYDQGKVAVINGIGYPGPNRSHFRSMDIWHTCAPEKVGTEGWLGRAIRDLDPNAENVLTGVNFGRGLPRAMALTGVPVASVAVLETYGVLTGITGEQERIQALDLFSRMYSPIMGTGPVMDYLGSTGLDALKGADILKTVPAQYQSRIKYSDSIIGRNLQGIAKVLTANLGTRIFYTEQPGYDTHANQGPQHGFSFDYLSHSINDLYEALNAHNTADNVLIYLFTEFGRRVKDNGSGSDHGSGGGCYLIGQPVKGGTRGDYPSLKEEDQLDGDLHFNVDFRSVYSTIVDKWLGLDAQTAIGGNYETLGFVRRN